MHLTKTQLKAIGLVLFKAFVGGAIAGIVTLYQSGGLVLDWHVIGWAAVSGGVVAVLAIIEGYFNTGQTAYGRGAKAAASVN